MNTRKLTNLLFVTYNSAASCFPNVLTAMFIFLTLPITTATAERFFSKLKLIKNYLSEVARQFANAEVRKVLFFA